MLQNIAKTLGLTAEEFDALLAVRDDLRAGKLSLDMRDGACCISGQMGHRLGISGISYTSSINKHPLGHPMRALCYPQPRENGRGFNGSMNPGYMATPAEAADAIDRALIGTDPWP